MHHMFLKKKQRFAFFSVKNCLLPNPKLSGFPHKNLKHRTLCIVNMYL